MKAFIIIEMVWQAHYDTIFCYSKPAEVFRILWEVKYVRYYKIFVVVILIFWAMPVKASFDWFDFMSNWDEFEVIDNSAQVYNEVRSSASTGGNTAEAGEVVAGEASSSASVKTIINGEVVENKTIKDIKKGDEAQVIVQTEVEVNNNNLTNINTEILPTTSRKENGSTLKNKTIQTEEEVEVNAVSNANFDPVQAEIASTTTSNAALVVGTNNNWEKFLDSFINIFKQILSIFL